ncbi:MAG: hypothetical protein LBU26_05270 [Synergistaceae bacterium]|jgi:hypothetical protein|nr:hypothetical protein [Synergistaceae bacterium]
MTREGRTENYAKRQEKNFPDTPGFPQSGSDAWVQVDKRKVVGYNTFKEREGLIAIRRLRLYLDNCCFNRPFDDQTQLKIHLETEAKVSVQQKIMDGLYELVWSYVLDYENGLNPFPERKHRISFWKNLSVIACDETEEILIEAEKLQAIGIKMFDSLHIACAVNTNCDYFLTTDKGILKKHITTIQAVDPIEFVKREYI